MAGTVSIRQRLLRDVVVMVLITGAAIIATTFIGVRAAVRSLSESIMLLTLDSVERQIRSFIEPVTRELHIARAWGEAGMLDLEVDPALPPAERDAAVLDVARRLNESFLPVMREIPQVSSILVADERGREYMLLRTDAAIETWMNVEVEGGGLERRLAWSSDAAAPARTRGDYDPRGRPWFQGAINAKRTADTSGGASIGASRGASGTAPPIFWSEPYTFFTTQEPGVTASTAYRAADGVTRVLGMDILLKDLSRFTQSLRIGERGAAVVLTGDNRILGLPRDPTLVEPEQLRAAYLKRPDELGLTLAMDTLRAFDASNADGPDRATLVRFSSAGEWWWGQARELHMAPERPVRIAVVVPETDVTGDLATQRFIIGGIVAAVLVIGVIRAAAIARRFSRPVEALVAETDRISRGDLAPPPPIESNVTEIGALSSSIDHMRDGLRSLLKMERDIQIARQIQQGAFPSTLPALAGFEIDAWSEPADETGGDTYDVIGIDERAGGTRRVTTGRADRAVMLLADATGHGIGPALSAATIRAMLRMAVRLHADLAEIARHLNEQLASDLPDERFITAWLGALDASTGHLTSFSAGQGPLLLYRAKDDAFEKVPTNAPPFGVMDDLPIEIAPAIALHAGDLFAVLSDGLIEARNAADEQFGADRARAILRERRHEPTASITRAIRDAVKAFVGDLPAADDKTIILIKRTA
jgi:serine phosphatase RsbU (regulator of sigma subunit)